MISLIQFEEFGPGMGFPSMKTSFSQSPYPNKDKVIAYLSKGRKTYSATSHSRDVFTGEMIPGERCGMTDGEYSWNSALAYYVGKYNLRLPSRFEEKAVAAELR